MDKEAAAVLESVVVTVMVVGTASAMALAMVMVAVMASEMATVSPLAMAMMAGPASRSATAVPPLSRHLAASIGRIWQPGGSPVRRPETLTRVVV